MDAALKELFLQGLVWKGLPPSEASAKPGGVKKKLYRESRAGTFHAVARFGIPEIDNLLPFNGLRFGCTHEWTLDCNFAGNLSGQGRRDWLPPLSIAAALLAYQLSDARQGSLNSPLDNYCIAWVGRKCWPTAQLLAETIGLNGAANCLFIDPPNSEKRLWATIQLLRCPAVFAVIADGSGLNLTAHRRLLLAAKKRTERDAREPGERGCPLLALIMRPPWEMEQSSPADTRWRVSPYKPPEQAGPRLNRDIGFRWLLELVKAKGPLKNSSPTARWILERKPRMELLREEAYGSENACNENSLRFIAAPSSTGERDDAERGDAASPARAERAAERVQYLAAGRV